MDGTVYAATSQDAVVRFSPRERILLFRSLLEVIPAYEHEQALRAELDSARTELRERKTIERAKGLLMTHQKMTEPEAFRWIQKASMDRRLTMQDVAKAIIEQLSPKKA